MPSEPERRGELPGMPGTRPEALQRDEPEPEGAFLGRTLLVLFLLHPVTLVVIGAVILGGVMYWVWW